MIMTQENKELLLKDLCARLPYDVKAQYYDNETKKLEAGTIVSFTIPIDETNQKYPTFITRRDLLIIQGNTIEDIKPYLFPLSSMTEEQKSYINGRWGINENFDFEIDPDWGEYFVNLGDAVGFIVWLIEHHFDYRGLIPKGLALDATYLNIY